MQRLLFFLISLAVLSGTGNAQSQPKDVTLTASDGTALKATFFPAAKPGPGVLLLHQCNSQRKSWEPLAKSLNSQGINVLTLDNRGFGESGGTPNDKLSPEEIAKVRTEKWPGDFDVALEYLLSQPSVQRDKVGAGGASCGVNNSVQLALRHPEVRSLMLLSGGTDGNGRKFLQKADAAPVFAAAADDDVFGNFTMIMQWYYSMSANPASRFHQYATGGHGAEMFPPHPELPALIAQWFAATLNNKPKDLPHTNGSTMPASQIQEMNMLDRPGGATEAMKMLTESRGQDSKAPFLPEFIVNLIAYEHLQAGEAKQAIEIAKLNTVAYPNSANVYDTLSDAYLADGQKDLALSNARRALELLASDTTDPEQRKDGIRQSAEAKVKQLSQPQ